MNSFFSNLQDYCSTHSSPQSQLLYELERETHLKTLAPQMMSGHLQGQLLQLLSRLMCPKRILEIGTFTGYATLCLASGLAADGRLHTIEANEELRYIIDKYIQRAQLGKQVQLHIGDAIEVIPTIDETFDIIFIDAGKQDYDTYYELCLPKLNQGGLLLADNVLWSGKVVDANKDADTKALHLFNEKVQTDERVYNLILPLRDGLLIAQKH